MFGLSRIAEAEEAFRAAIRLFPGSAAATFNLGLCLLLRKDRDGASRLCATLRALDPRTANRFEALLRSRLGAAPARSPARPGPAS